MKTPEQIADIRADIIADIQIDALDPAAADVQALVAAADAFYDGLYPQESSHLEALDDLNKPNVLFFGCRVDGKLVASGAAKLMDDDGDYAEIKRIFVLDAYRGQGLSAKIMSYLESELQRRGVILLRLETGVLQPEALGLYRKLGYRERGPFGAYGADPLSVFMEKSVFMGKSGCVQNAKPDPA
jgi:putative acetyltransferase